MSNWADATRLSLPSVQLCTCYVITGGHRVPVSVGCPVHTIPTTVPNTTGANPMTIMPFKVTS